MMNPCECIFNQLNHELSMRRLLSFLRQTQDECTDTECLDSTNVGLNGEGMADNNLMMYYMMWVAIAFLLFIFRPQSLRNNKNPFQNSDQDNDDGAGPSSPRVQSSAH